jgi:hypothetical protein
MIETTRPANSAKLRAYLWLPLLALTACDTAKSVDENGNSILPEQAEAYYHVDIGLRETRAWLHATFWKGALTDIEFAAGETLSVNGMTLEEGGLLGVSYFTYGPLIDPGEAYTFVLTVPNKGVYSTPVPMLEAATLTAPAAGAQLRTSDHVTIAWTNSDPLGTDEVDVSFAPNGDGESAHSTLKALPGSTSVALSSTQLKAFYQVATGSVGGAALGTLRLKRTNSQAMKRPFKGGTATIERELAEVSITLMAD